MPRLTAMAVSSPNGGVTHHFGGDERTRTADPLLAKQVLYQLSYVPEVTLDHTDSLEPMPERTMSVPGRSHGR